MATVMLRHESWPRCRNITRYAEPTNRPSRTGHRASHAPGDSTFCPANSTPPVVVELHDLGGGPGPRLGDALCAARRRNLHFPRCARARSRSVLAHGLGLFL